MANEPELIKLRRYDPSMSKRTRKPRIETQISLNQDYEDVEGIYSSACSLNQEDDMLENTNGISQLSLSFSDQDDKLQNDGNGIHRSSLRELMNQGNGQEKVSNADSNKGDKVGSGKKEAMSGTKG